jgi:hypothetical protein
MKYSLIAVLGLALCTISFGAAAQTTDDVIAMANKGVGEEVLIATVERSTAGFELTAAQILKLKEAKVSDKVIQTMLKHKPVAAAANPRPEAPVAAQPPIDVVPANNGGREVAGDGTLNIENVDDKTWAYMYEPEVKTIWITGSAEGKGNLQAHGGVSLRMAAGTYKVRYNGKDSGPSVTVRAGEKSLLMLSRVETDEVEALYISVFENGERKGGGRLAQLRAEAPRAESRANVEENDEASEAGEPRERVVERRVIEVPQTTVIYRDSYEPAPIVVYDSYPRYYGYSPRSYFSFGFGLSSGHHHHHYSHSYRGGSYYGGSYRGGSGYRSR